MTVAHPPVLRIARPTNDLDAIAEMYRVGLELQVIGHFENHDGLDGVMLGTPGGTYHLEFTSKNGHDAPRSPSEDNLLVFYIPERQAWEAGCARMEAAGFKCVPAFNRYWDRSGRTFEDPDGYRVVLHNTRWPL